MKERLFVCYYCRRKSIKNEMLREELTRLGKDIIRYYHPECKKVETTNKENKVSRTGVGNTESIVHSELKVSIYKSVKNNKLTIIDQFENEIKLSGELVSMESPVAKQFIDYAPFNNSNSCASCFGNYSIDNSDELIKRICDNKEVRQGLHPCHKCPFNTLKYYYIFDVAIATNGIYTDAIEVLHTSKIKKGKINYCIKHNINLYEVETSEQFEGNILRVNKIWWKDSNCKLNIHDSYVKLFS